MNSPPQTILLNTLISEFVVLDNPLNKQDEKAAAINETVQGLILLDTHLIVYGQFTWVVFDMTGKELSRHRRRRMSSFEDDDAACERPMLVMKMESLDNFSVIYWSGDEANHDMSIETYKEGRILTRYINK